MIIFLNFGCTCQDALVCCVFRSFPESYLISFFLPYWFRTLCANNNRNNVDKRSKTHEWSVVQSIVQLSKIKNKKTHENSRKNICFNIRARYIIIIIIIIRPFPITRQSQMSWTVARNAIDACFRTGGWFLFYFFVCLGFSLSRNWQKYRIN